MGGIIDAFQGHHKYPWTITKRQFANNIHTTCPATMCVTVPLLPRGLERGRRRVHGNLLRAHRERAAVPRLVAHEEGQPHELVVKARVAAGLILSWYAHGAHHRPPFRAATAAPGGGTAFSGSGFFTRVERSVFEVTERSAAVLVRRTTTVPCRRRRRRGGGRASCDAASRGGDEETYDDSLIL